MNLICSNVASSESSVEDSLLAPCYRMKRAHRLRRNSDFQRVRRLGQSRANALAVLTFLPNDLDYSRIGFVVSKRLGPAVHRNRLKRQMREVVRLRLPSLRPGFDLVFIARQPVKEAPYSEIAWALTSLLEGADLLSK